MYCYITENNTAGEIFEAMPPADRYHPDFIARIVEMPEGTPLNSVYDWQSQSFLPPPLPSVDKLRSDALQRIDGKCSTTIYSGVTVGDKHYKLTPTAQGNLKTALDKVASGATSVIYAADNEEPTLHTAAQITAINSAAYEWGVVNTTYYSKLQKWITRETDTAMLNAIDYGKQLPADLMQELTDLLTSAGIDVTKYTGLFTGDNT